MPEVPVPVLLAALAPVIVPQAVMARRFARVMPEPAGPRAGRAGEGRPLKVLVAGDSSAAGVGVAWQDQALTGRLVRRLARRFDVSWRIEARSGLTTAGLVERLEGARAEAFDAVVLGVGVNDVTRGVRRRDFLRRQARLRTLLRARFGARRFYVTGLPPVGEFPLLPDPLRRVVGLQAARFDRALRGALAGEEDARRVPFDTGLDPALMAADGFHPGPAIYETWAERMERAILRDFG
ncbi:lysophospholipase L1-like esterase [Hasllibacter halocynthiae]|uniref:Lysophospholipase L1-like esterase n=2 Tax=Hasllibacter halocynthiae TaxID=595589 RepID=A0A2T0X183_9RHOB|nr:lysophospholipase L1-like esterase [Hasllibacter halocynthiae]